MAIEIRSFAPSIPAGTPIAAPFVFPIVFPPRQVVQIDWQVPPGPSGLMGWALTIDGQPVIPRNAGAYIITDDRIQSWQLENYPDQGQWQLTGYNLDIYPHSVYLDFLLELTGAATATPAQLPNDQLSSPPPPASAPVLQLPDLGLVTA